MRQKFSVEKLQEYLAAKYPSGWDWAIGGLLFLFALLLRFLRAGDGLPYMHFWDEPEIAFNALDMLKNRDLNPHYFNYGSLLMYLNLGVDLLHLAWLKLGGVVVEIGDVVYGKEAGFDWYISHPSFLLWNRCLTVLLGSLSVLIVFYLGFKLFGRLAGVSAALVLAGIPFHVTHSAFVTTDIPMSFFVWAAVLFAYLFLVQEKNGWLYASLAACGLATAVKYNAGLSVLVPSAALLLSGKALARKKLWLAVPLVPALAFFIGMPYALFDLQNFVEAAIYEARHYSEIGHGGASVTPGWPHLVLQLQTFWQNLGWLTSVLVLVGLVRWGKKRAGWLFLPYLTIYFISVIQLKVSFHRNLVVFYPALALAFGAGLDWLWASLGGIRRSKALIRGLQIVVLGLAAAFLAYTSFQSLRSQWAVCAVPETRAQAVSQANQLLAGRADVKVGVAQELRMHPQDLTRLHAEVDVLPLVELLANADDYDLLMGFARARGSNPRQREIARQLNLLVEQIPPERYQQIGSAPLFVQIFSQDPAVILIHDTEGLVELIDIDKFSE